MKTHPKAPGAASPMESRRGVALITVLTIISLCTILVLTFFQLAQNEMVSSDSYNSGLEAQQVAEQAVNLVIKQIREATSDEQMGWASQPGMIRTWNMTGNFSKAYKLYSDEMMVLGGTGGSESPVVQEDFGDLKNWDSRPAEFVDLNEPVIRGDKVYYPIVDPSAREIPKWKTATERDSAGVEGFHYTLAGISPGPMAKAVGEANPKDGVKREPLPMPVKWIYQLKDGTLGYLTGGNRFTPVSGGTGATEQNPIVARFAFWADDETCKLNPNTHSGGASWSTPVAAGMIDRNLGRFQPTQHEWQRYPGHPAATHLAPVLAPGILDITYDRDAMEMIFALVPRVVGGGSVSGTKKVDPRNPQEANGLIADKDRLYATLDEFFLEPGARRNPPTSDDSIREPNEFPQTRGGGGIDPQDQMERSRFFLSVVSRAPETTVFNTPRISIWPTHWKEAPNWTHPSGKSRHTVFDTLIRYCAEIGGGAGNKHIYHFQRYNADSEEADYKDIVRNQYLYKYLQNMLETPIPGVGKSFEDKYSDRERNQLLTLIFDYIRTTNLHDDSLFQEDWQSAFTKQNEINPLTYTNGRRVDNTERSVHKGHGQVTPIVITEGERTRGMGRHYTMSESGVVVICAADGADGSGGGRFRTHSPGIMKYPGTQSEAPTGEVYSNFPPMPLGIDRNNKVNWPDWLKALEGTQFLDMAFDEKNWNWQLAWLDRAYVDAMYNSSSNNIKFNRSALNEQNFQSGHTRLKKNQKMAQAAFIFSMFCPSLGWVPINPDFELEIKFSGMDFIPTPPKDTDDSEDDPTDEDGSDSGDGSEGDNLGEDEWQRFASIGWTARNADRHSWATSKNQTAHHDRFYGGVKPATFFLSASSNNSGAPSASFPTTGNWVVGYGKNGRLSPVDVGFTTTSNIKSARRYDFVTRPFLLGSDNQLVEPTVNMEGGVVIWRMYSSKNDGETEETATQGERDYIQGGRIKFPGFSVPAPALAEGRQGYINEFNALEYGKSSPMEYWSLTYDGVNPLTAGTGRMARVNGYNGGIVQLGDVVQSVAVRHGDLRTTAPLRRVWSKHFAPHKHYGKQQMAHGFSYTTGGREIGADTEGANYWTNPAWRYERPDVPYYTAPAKSWALMKEGQLVPHLTYNPRPILISAVDAKDVQLYGDFDNGMGAVIDGPYINKPDEGNTHSLFKRTDPNSVALGNFEMARDYGDFPYFVRDWIHEAGTPSYFSPNRIISSPGQFGSLPSGVAESTGTLKPWQTLLFRPNVVGNGYQSHPGAITPADHYLLDLFWMPVVEPYAISEPLSTGGKVNINYQILPFRHIHRSTAIRGILKSEYLVCIPNRWTIDYKVGVGRGRNYHWRDNPYGGTLEAKSLRAIILEDETLAQFEAKFNHSTTPTLFKTASEFCEIHLVPQEQSERMKQGGAAAKLTGTYTPKLAPESIDKGFPFGREVAVGKVPEMENGKYWYDHAAVGDNSRERPYSNIYPRITTKSNTFKVHYRAQVVAKAKGTAPDTWDPLLDQVVAEYRGSSIVERYVEPENPDIPDYARNFGSGADTIDKFYKFRVVQPTRFAP